MRSEKSLSELKKRALLAKQRLKMGYWQRLERERREMEESSDMCTRNISELQREKIRRDAMCATDEQRYRQEEQLYEKVCRILDEDSDTLSPIGQLIDKEKYQKLDECGKQKYILELSKKFRELSHRYYLEHVGKSV